MKVYSRYYTLLKLVEERGLGWAQTNEYGSASKSHFLQMRREKLVDYTVGYDKRIIDLIIKGPDINAYFYTITPKGLSLLSKLFPNNEMVEDTCREFIKNVFENDFWIKEFKLRVKGS